MNPENTLQYSIVMPAFNEEGNIETTVRQCFAALERNGYSGEVVVTDDGSRDHTGEILQTLQAEFPRLRVVRHIVNTGYGEALYDAILAADGEYIVTIDSDGQFDIFELPSLVAEREKGFAVVTGFRHKKRDSLVRVAADRILNLIIRLFFGLQVRDSNCALKLIPRETLQRIRIEARGYPAPTEILVKLKVLGCTIGQTGITHWPRTLGMSALHPVRTGWNMLRFLLYLRIKIGLFRKKIIQHL